MIDSFAKTRPWCTVPDQRTGFSALSDGSSYIIGPAPGAHSDHDRMAL